MNTQNCVMLQPIMLWNPNEIPVIEPISYESLCATFPAMMTCAERTDSSVSKTSSVSSEEFSDCSSEVSFKSKTSTKGEKQELILSVTAYLDSLLQKTFKAKMQGEIMTVYANEKIENLDFEQDVLRGRNVLNIRAKSIQSLDLLSFFLEKILDSEHVQASRVDVILQKKKTNQLKGLLVNIELSSQADLEYIRDEIWVREGLDMPDMLPKVMPAVFAQDCSWVGTSASGLYVKDTTTGVRVSKASAKLTKANITVESRIKSITVVDHSGRKAKTYEVRPQEFMNVLEAGKFEHVETKKKKTSIKVVELNETSKLTISFEQDWETEFWTKPLSFGASFFSQ